MRVREPPSPGATHKYVPHSSAGQGQKPAGDAPTSSTDVRQPTTATSAAAGHVQPKPVRQHDAPATRSTDVPPEFSQHDVQAKHEHGTTNAQWATNTKPAHASACLPNTDGNVSWM